jgi:hypothetical protein
MTSLELDRRGAWLIAGSLTVLLVVAGAAGWRASHLPQMDPQTLRVAGHAETGEVVILLDATDPFSKEQQASFEAWVRQLETDLEPQEHVTLWALGAEEAGGLQRRFARYYPGRESDPIMHNPAMSAAACDSLFTQPLSAAVVGAMPQKSSRYSFLLDAVRELSVQPELDVQRGRRRLVLVSDLRVNEPGLSFYRAVPRFEQFQHSRHFPRVRAQLHRVSVEVLYLSRGAWDIARPDLREFWRSHLAFCGAQSVSLRRL